MSYEYEKKMAAEAISACGFGQVASGIALGGQGLNPAKLPTFLESTANDLHRLNDSLGSLEAALIRLRSRVFGPQPECTSEEAKEASYSMGSAAAVTQQTHKALLRLEHIHGVVLELEKL